MLAGAKELTGYVRKKQQIEWLQRYGFVHGKHWYEQTKNGKIVVLLCEEKSLSLG